MTPLKFFKKYCLTFTQIASSSLSLVFLAHQSFGLQFPVRVTSWDITPQIETVTVNLTSAVTAEDLYLRVHNLRFGGQVSVQVNSGDWITIYNNSPEVSFPDFELKQDGIGGINSTIRFYVDIDPADIVQGGENYVRIRVNGTDGRSTTIRVLDLDFVDASNVSAVSTSFSDEDPSTWTAPVGYQDAASIDAGRILWDSDGILLDNIVAQRSIKASCAACHFDDGSDLRYFNFSNESIVSRSQFHGLSEHQGNQIAAYIRSLNLNLPGGMNAPGRPWDPPFQPGPDTDPQQGDSQLTKDQKAASWLAGQGLDAVAETDGEIISELLPEGTDFGSVAEIMDYTKNLSMRDIRMTIQLPDWNAWLPDHAPVDIWPDDLMIDAIQPERPDYLAGTKVNEGPQIIYERLLTDLITNGVASYVSDGTLWSRFSAYMSDIEDKWYGDMRMSQAEFNNGDDELYGTTSAPIIFPHISRDEMRKSIVKWRAVKGLYLVRRFELEDVQPDAAGVFAPDYTPEYDPDPLSLPAQGTRQWVWAHAAHIISKNWSNFEEQLYRTGKQESNQWYLLEVLLNSGPRRPAGMNSYVDWGYVKNHMIDAYNVTKHDFFITRAAYQINMMQSRYTGKPALPWVPGNPSGTESLFSKLGFSQRTLAPNFFYSDETANRGLFLSADKYAPDLWRRLFEEYLHEWLYIYESEDVNTIPRDPPPKNGVYKNDRNIIEHMDYIPAPWDKPSDVQSTAKIFLLPDEIFSEATYRLLQKNLLQDAGVNEALLLDFARWLGRAFPKVQDNPNGADWDAAGVPHWDDLIVPRNLYLQNFETSSDFSGLSREMIKDSNYVNLVSSTIPRNGGGAYVASRRLNPGQSRDTQAGVTIPLNGKTRLKTSIRTGFSDQDNTGHGTISGRIILTFDSTTQIWGPFITMNPDLYNYKFQSLETEFNVPAGSTNLTQVRVRWSRGGGSGNGDIYLDNVLVEDASPVVDSIAPFAPTNIKATIANGDFGIKIRFQPNAADNEPFIGYNIYRWASAVETRLDAVKLNKDLHTRLYGQYFDDTAWPGVEYSYVVTAVDAAGNESVDSSTKNQTLPSALGAVLPDWTFLTNYSSGVDLLQWFGTPNIDLFGFKVYRRAANESGFTELTSGATMLPLGFDDTGFIDGALYEYYVNPVTSLEEGDNSASVLKVGAHYSYDASVAVNVLVDSNDRVTQWNDVSGFGFDAVPQSSETQTYPSVIQSPTSLDMIEFDGSNRFRLISVSEAGNILNFSAGGGAENNSGFTTLCAIRFDNITSAKNPVVATSGSTSSGFGIRISSGGNPEVYIGGALYQNTGVTITGGDTIILGFSYDKSTGDWTLFESKAGTTISGNTPAADFTGSKEIYAGGSGNGGQRIDGQIGEVRILKEGMSIESLISECLYLESKWIGGI
ncbi:MAG: hypothetical protein AAGJ81_01875 [Verrucomicrobiota bacterium]